MSCCYLAGRTESREVQAARDNVTQVLQKRPEIYDQVLRNVCKGAQHLIEWGMQEAMGLCNYVTVVLLLFEEMEK